MLANFTEFVLLVESLTEKKVNTLCSDNGSEYTSIEFHQFCTEHGIKMELTVPMTPEQNGNAERINRTMHQFNVGGCHYENRCTEAWVLVWVGKSHGKGVGAPRDRLCKLSFFHIYSYEVRRWILIP